LLKKNGFKKKKLSWNRARGSFVDIIDIQEHQEALKIMSDLY